MDDEGEGSSVCRCIFCGVRPGCGCCIEIVARGSGGTVDCSMVLGGEVQRCRLICTVGSMSGGSGSGETERFTLPHRQGGMAPAALRFAS
jgi:hypothetical protein